MPPEPPPPPAAEEKERDRPYQTGKLFGAYTLRRIIAEGGMGVVIEAEHNVIKRLVALKTVSPKYAAREGFKLALMDTFMRDARILGKIDHPNVLPIYDAGTVGHCPFMAMRLVTGGDLQTWVTSHGPVSDEIALRVAHDVGSGLKAIHAAGFLHRDIKPLNILIESDWQVFICDFGLALPKGQKPSGDSIAGTPCYLPPEQIRNEDIDERADLYALGATLFYSVTGQPPFTGDQPAEILGQILQSHQPPNPKSHVPNLDDRIAAIITRAMGMNLVDRYANLDEFMGDCASVLADGTPDYALRKRSKRSLFGSISRVFSGGPAATTPADQPAR